MSDSPDTWYVRFPDGRVLRAANSTIVRRQLRSGRIPPGSLVRRSRVGVWSPPEEMHELAGGPEAENGVGRTSSDPGGPSLNVRGLIDGLVAALDRTLVRRNLLAAAVAGALLGGLAVVLRWPPPGLAEGWPWLIAWLALLVGAGLVGLLAQFTYAELARLRPAGWGEGARGLGLLALRYAILLAFGVGAVVGLHIGGRWLSASLIDLGLGLPFDILGGAIVVLTAVLEAVLWPLALTLFLLPPILIVEGTGLWRTVREWAGLLRQHFGRVMLYEALALAGGALLAVPFALPAYLAGMDHDPRLAPVAVAARDVLLGIALAPVLAYLGVANLLLYLALRYDFDARR